MALQGATPTLTYGPVLPPSTVPRSSTPPNMGATAAMQDTPTHHRMTSVLPYSSINGQFVEPAFLEAARELKKKFVLVAPDKFLAKYLPQHPCDMPTIDHKTFKEVTFKRRTDTATAKFKQIWIKKKVEKNMYEPMVHLSLISECISVLIPNR